MERTRGNLIRERERRSKRVPVFAVVAASRRVASRGVVIVVMVERIGATPKTEVILENEVLPFLHFFQYSPTFFVG